MKMLLVAAALTFASFAHAENVKVQDQDMAAVCQDQMDRGEDLSPTCEARLSCIADGVQDAACQTYCAQYPADTDACTATAESQANTEMNAEMSRRWHRHHRSWFCRRHPFAPACRWGR